MMENINFWLKKNKFLHMSLYWKEAFTGQAFLKMSKTIQNFGQNDF